MDKILDTCNYGICLFSVGVLQDFLKREKIRSKKLLGKFQKDKELYLTTQKEGIWLPIVGINSGSYIIKLDGYEEPFGDEWEQMLEYDGFNLEIQDNLCISDVGLLGSFDANDFSEYEKSYQTLDGNTNYQQFKYDVPSGKYLISVTGYARKQASENNLKHTSPEYGFLFSLKKTDIFDSYKNPREDELYEFNIGWLAKSKEATVYWLTEEEGGSGKLLDKREYTAIIQLEDDDICHLYMRFEKTDAAQNERAHKCRVSRLLQYKKHEGLLHSNAEYILYEEKRKRGKATFEKVGRIVIT